ncbi:MAG: HAD family phosphatase [Pseudomonadota bacterium]
MMPPGLVIFDCDGVLVDTEPRTNAWIADQISKPELPITANECRRRFVGLSMSAIRPIILKENDVDTGADFVARWDGERSKNFAAGVDPMAGIEQALNALDDRAIPYCVASSGTVDKMHLTLASAGLLQRLDNVLYSASIVQNGKPAPDLFLFAAQQMGFSPGNCVVIEDSPFGAAAAKAAGMTCFGYAGDPMTDASGLAKEGARLFRDMRELFDLLAGRGAA